MRVPSGHSRFELSIKGSLFIAEIDSVPTITAAEERIKDKRKVHPDAAHVVYAFSIGDANSQQFGMSDDGEPKGTAGRPALEVMKGSGVTDCLLTIVRYFGGTKLGTGGLVHAYGDAAKGAFASLSTSLKRDLIEIRLDVPYELHHNVQSALEAFQPDTMREEFAEGITIRCGIDKERLEEFQDAIRDVSRGTIRVRTS